MWQICVYQMSLLCYIWIARQAFESWLAFILNDNSSYHNLENPVLTMLAQTQSCSLLSLFFSFLTKQFSLSDLAQVSLALWFPSKVTSHKATDHGKCMLCNYIKIHYRDLFILHFFSTSSAWEHTPTLHRSACEGSSPWRKITVNPAAQPAPAAPTSHPSAWLSGRHSYLIC